MTIPKPKVDLPQRGDVQGQLVGLPTGHLQESGGRTEHAGDRDEAAWEAIGEKTSKQGANGNADEEMRKQQAGGKLVEIEDEPAEDGHIHERHH
jgi:hypothetical protein